MYIRKKNEPERKYPVPAPYYEPLSTRDTREAVFTRTAQPRKTTGSFSAADPVKRYTKSRDISSPYEPQENPWVSGGAFRDGYQFGDLAKGITGTILDTTQNVFAGAARIGETAIDSVAGRIAGVGLFEDELSEFVKRDLINEEAVGGVLARNSLPGLASAIFGVDPERDSFLGEKGDSLAQSAGQYVFTRGLNSIGIPGEAVSGVVSYGGEMENALLQGATPREANISAGISARGEILSEKLSGGIKFGGKAADDVLVDYLSDRISNKFWKTLTKATLGGIGEGNEEIVSEMISRFGQWITYQDNKTIQEMLFSGEAREAYLDSFLSGFALGFPSAGIDTVLLENRGYSGKPADAALDIPAPAAPVGTLTDGGLRSVKALSDGKTPDVSTAAADGGARAAEILKNQAQTPSAPRAQLNDNVRAQTSVTPQLQADMQASDRAADTVSNSADAQTDIRTDTEAVPVRYEDALRDYLESGLDSAAEPDVGRSPSSGVDTLQSAELNSDLVLSQDAAPETTQQVAPKTKEQLVSELAPKISKPGITPGRATIEAQRLYTDVERIFGSNADAVLEMFQPGQDPRKYLDGFRNAYIAGKLGNKAALENSTAAAYLTEEQREAAYTLGGMAAPKVSAGTDSVTESIPSVNPEGKKTDLLSIREGGKMEEKRAAFKKAFQEGKISTRISPQKQARHIFGTRQFQEYDAKLSARGDHPSYLRKDLTESELIRSVVSKLQGKIIGTGNRTYEFVSCDETIGYYYSKANGEYVETQCAQVIYAVKEGNIHIVPVKQK